VALASWVLIAAMVVGGAWRFKTSPPSIQQIQLAWFPSLAVAAPQTAGMPGAPGTPGDAAAEAAIAAKTAAVEAKVSATDIKVSWPFRSTDDFQTLTPTETLEATKAQTAYAMQRGRAIAAPYRRETINSLVLFEVPVGDKIGVMIFDGGKDALAAPRVFILPYRPPARAWVELAGKKAVVVPE
jgi:hypothetical protein